MGEDTAESTLDPLPLWGRGSVGRSKHNILADRDVLHVPALLPGWTVPDGPPGVGERWDTQGPRRCVPGANVGHTTCQSVFSFCVEVSATL